MNLSPGTREIIFVVKKTTRYVKIKNIYVCRGQVHGTQIFIPTTITGRHDYDDIIF